MSDSSEGPGIFVQATGTTKAIVGGAVGGGIGAVVKGGAPGSTSPLVVQQVGYLVPSPTVLTLYGAKRKVMLGGFKADERVLATVPRHEVAGATFDAGRVIGALTVHFTDGSQWAFEVPKVGNKGAAAAVAAMSGG